MENDTNKPVAGLSTEDTGFNWAKAVKIVTGVTTASFFAWGVRTAWKQARPDSKELNRFKLLSGVGFASKALGLATVITVSGYSLFLIGISSLLNVNTPSEFGQKMRDTFGDRYRIAKGTGENYDSLTELMEALNAQSKEARATKQGVAEPSDILPTTADPR